MRGESVELKRAFAPFHLHTDRGNCETRGGKERREERSREGEEMKKKKKM